MLILQLVSTSSKRPKTFCVIEKPGPRSSSPAIAGGSKK